MRPTTVDDLEGFVRRGDLWRPIALDLMAARLRAESTSDGGEELVEGRLASTFDQVRALLVAREAAGVPVTTSERVEVEGAVYPKLWKLMEGVRDGMPVGELRTRTDVLARRVAESLPAVPAVGA
jgi:hypothetical protein